MSEKNDEKAENCTKNNIVGLFILSTKYNRKKEKNAF